MGVDDFRIHYLLGEGTYSNVYKVLRLADGQEYAMKIAKIEGISDVEKQNAINEVRLLASIKSQYIVSYKEAFLEADKLYIIMEYAPGGDLKRKIKLNAAQNKLFSEDEVWRMIGHMTKALSVLHKLKIVHCDIKSANVFITSNGSFKLADLNVSKVSKNGLIYSQTGTPYYAAPEVWQDQPFDQKSDIWSLGVVIYEMCCLQLPFLGNTIEELFKNVVSSQYKDMPSAYSNELKGFVRKLLQKQSTKRPSCDQILASEALKRLQLSQFQEINQLLSTIRPEDIQQLGRMLPKPAYSNKPFELNRSTTLPPRELSRSPTKKQSPEKSKERVQLKTSNPNTHSVQSINHLASIFNLPRRQNSGSRSPRSPAFGPDKSFVKNLSSLPTQPQPLFSQDPPKKSNKQTTTNPSVIKPNPLMKVKSNILFRPQINKSFQRRQSPFRESPLRKDSPYRLYERRQSPYYSRPTHVSNSYRQPQYTNSYISKRQTPQQKRQYSPYRGANKLDSQHFRYQTRRTNYPTNLFSYRKESRQRQQHSRNRDSPNGVGFRHFSPSKLGLQYLFKYKGYRR